MNIFLDKMMTERKYYVLLIVILTLYQFWWQHLRVLLIEHWRRSVSARVMGVPMLLQMYMSVNYDA